MNKLILFNEPVKSVRKLLQTIHSRIGMIQLQLFWNSRIQMIHLERVSSELNSSKNWEILWAIHNFKLTKLNNFK